MYESSWGMKGAAKVKNLGGLGGVGPAGTHKEKSKDFRAYHNFSEFYRDYTNLICNSARYQDAIGKKGREYQDILKKAHYDVTDADYVKHVMEIYRQLGFK
jgi:flagellum-specific peptidoglycan hydrolase FlgJ